jgi:ADP-ribosylation factor-like protein 8
MGLLLSKIRSLFARKMEMVIVGLENSGKTTFINTLSDGDPGETVPTIGLNVKTVNKGNLIIKAWDLGGQVQYRTEWSRYAKGTNVIIFVVDSSAIGLISYSRKELHTMLEERDLIGIPLLVLSNKIDIHPHLTEPEIIQGLNLDYVIDNPWLVISISALKGTNIERVVDWLLNIEKR